MDDQQQLNPQMKSDKQSFIRNIFLLTEFIKSFQPFKTLPALQKRNPSIKQTKSPLNPAKILIFLSQFYIQFIQIGGMAKSKKKPTNNKTLPLKKPKNQPTLSFEAPLAPPTQPQPGLKRKINDLSHFIKKEESVSPPTVQKKYFIHQILKQRSISIQVLVLQCPNFQAAIQKIYNLTGISKDLIYSTVQSLFQGSKHQLWSDKYAPKNLKQCLHKNFGQKIMKWIRIYMNYRNCYPEESNSLLDYFGDGSSNSEYKCLRENGWKLKGLILKGRSGVGKSTSIHVTAKQLQCEIFHCGNECNQIKYLRQRNEATQSECVKMKINKNQAQIQKTNQTLTSFATRSDQNQSEQQSKRIQFMHNVNNFYPREDEAKFFNQLNKTVESSKIPFLMTLAGENVPESLKIYDIIDFEQAKTQDIARLLFLIYHIERSFSSCLDFEKIVERENFKEELNDQLKYFEFTIVTPFEDFVKITQIGNKKLDFLFSFVQNSLRLSKELSISQAEHFMKEYLNRADEGILLNEYFYSFNPLTLEKEEASFLEESIDSKYLILTQNDQKIENQAQVLDSTSSNSKKLHEAKSNKKVIQENDNFQMKKQRKFTEIIKELDMNVIEDYKQEVHEDECSIFNRLYNQSRDDLEEDLIQNISIKRHTEIRKKIVKNVKRQFYFQNELTTSLKEKELNFIGFLIDSRSRVSRKKINREEINLKKYLKNNEIHYLETFTEILKPNSCEAKS